MSPPVLSFGIAAVPADDGEAAEFLQLLHDHNIKQIDTARIYPGSEERVKAIGANTQFTITTKVSGFHSGSGKRESVLASAKASFDALGIDKVYIYLLHSPDPTTPIGETLDAVQEVYKQGRFEKFGLSNFTAEQVQEAYDYSKSHGYILPTVYQSNYNLVARKNETLLFPTLRRLGISIQAYSPFAGGFLAKTPEYISAGGSGRWNPATPLGAMYHGLYNKPLLLEYLRQFSALAEKSGAGRGGLAYRWMRYHSALGAADTVVFSATSLTQLKETLKVIEQGPLETWVVERLEEMWKAVEKEAPVDNYSLAVAEATDGK